jgi:hypothetical protein
MTGQQQFPLQLLHLMMASWVKTCSVRIIGSDKFFEVQYINEVAHGQREMQVLVWVLALLYLLILLWEQ